MRAAWLIVGIVLAARPAVAETDDVKATALFEEGLALRDRNLEEACKKFEQALAFNPQATGILLNVALCDERFGRIASAAQRFTEARDRAAELARSGTRGVDATIKAAEDHLSKLTPDIPYLTIQLAERPPELLLVIDGEPIAIAPGTSHRLAIDPGERTIVVTAPGRAAYRTRLAIAKGEARELAIPQLATASNVRRTAGKLTALGGAAALGAGVAIGLVARARYNRQFDAGLCHADTGICDTPDAQGEIDSARTLGNVATVTGVLGVLAAGIGGYLWLRAPSEGSPHRVALIPHLAPDAAFISATGRF